MSAFKPRNPFLITIKTGVFPPCIGSFFEILATPSRQDYLGCTPELQAGGEARQALGLLPPLSTRPPLKTKHLQQLHWVLPGCNSIRGAVIAQTAPLLPFPH
eukprot:1159038-Pelagomonas_calceolata.AAC.2